MAAANKRRNEIWVVSSRHRASSLQVFIGGYERSRLPKPRQPLTVIGQFSCSLKRNWF